MCDNTSRRGRFGWLVLLTAALGLSAAGCKDDKKPDVEVAASKTKEVAPSGPMEKLTAPENVVVYGGSESLASLTKKIALIGGPVAAATMNSAAIGQGLANSLALKDSSALALDKPFRFAIIDPKKSPEPMVTLVSTTGMDKLVAALPAGHKKDEAGNAYSYTAKGKTLYLNFIDDFAVFSYQPAVFGANKAFLIKLAGATPGSDGAAVLAVAHSTKIYADELKQIVKDAEKAIPSSPGMPMAGAGIGKMAEWFANTAGEMDRIVVRLDGLADGGKLGFEVVPKEGSELKKTFGALGTQKLELLDKIPADAPLAFAMAMDPDVGGELTQSLTAWSLQLSLGEDVDEKYVTAMNEYFKATSGQMMFAAHSVPGVEGLRFSGLMGIRDADKARASQTTLRELYDREAFKKTYADMGLSMTFKPNAYKVGDVPVDRVEAKLDDTAGDANLKQTLGPSAALFGDMMNSHVALASPLGVIAYGEDGKSVIEAWLGGKVPGGFAKAPGVVRALQNAAPGLFMVMYGAPLDVMQAMKLGAPMPNAPSSKNGLALTAGAKGGSVHIVLDLPTEQVTALMSMAMSMQGGMGQPGGMRPGGGPGGL
jgi:hypothetical protein